jgi:hypothetical protein
MRFFHFLLPRWLDTSLVQRHGTSYTITRRSAMDILNVCVLLHLVLSMSRPPTIPMLDTFLFCFIPHGRFLFRGILRKQQVDTSTCNINHLWGHFGSSFETDHWRLKVESRLAWRGAQGSLLRTLKSNSRKPIRLKSLYSHIHHAQMSVEVIYL